MVELLGLPIIRFFKSVPNRHWSQGVRTTSRSCSFPVCNVDHGVSCCSSIARTMSNLLRYERQIFVLPRLGVLVLSALIVKATTYRQNLMVSVSTTESVLERVLEIISATVFSLVMRPIAATNKGECG